MSLVQSNYFSNITTYKDSLKHHLIPLILTKVIMRKRIVKCQAGKYRYDIGTRCLRRNMQKSLR